MAQVINGLKRTRSVRHDKISTKSVIRFSNYLSQPTATLVNEMFVTRAFPWQLKIAKIVPPIRKDIGKKFKTAGLLPFFLLS